MVGASAVGVWGEFVAKLTVTPGYWLLLAGVYYLGGLSWTGLWIGAVGLHELGHILALLLLKVPVYSGRVSLAGACIDTGAMTYGQEMVAALAGPMVGLLPLLFWKYIPQFAIVSLLLSLINLLPLYPLDGGRALACALQLWTTPRCCYLVMSALEWSVGIFLTGWALYATFFQEVGLWPLLFLFFLGFRMLCVKCTG